MNRDQTANLLLGLIVAAGAAGGVLWLAAHAAARLVAADRPEADLISGVWALVNSPGDPAAAWHTDLGAVAYWIVVAALVAVAAAVAVVLWRAMRPRVPRRETDPHRLAGLPTGRAAVRTAGVKPLLARAGVLRPSLAEKKRVRPEQVGYRIGRVGRRDVWLSVEDSLLVLGPPRSGKGMNTVVPMILEAPGAVVTTSLFTDNIALTGRVNNLLDEDFTTYSTDFVDLNGDGLYEADSDEVQFTDHYNVMAAGRNYWLSLQVSF